MNRMVVRDSKGQEVTSIAAAEQPDDPMIYKKEGQKQSYATFRKWHRCWSCGIEFPEEEMVKFRGRWYGIPCSDCEDIQQLKRKSDA